MYPSVRHTISQLTPSTTLDSLHRYLRASKWKTQVAIQRLESTLKWRREYGLYDFLTNDLISIEVCQILFFRMSTSAFIRFGLTTLTRAKQENSLRSDSILTAVLYSTWFLVAKTPKRALDKCSTPSGSLNGVST